MRLELIVALVVLLAVGLGGVAIGRATATTGARPGAEAITAPDPAAAVVPSPLPGPTSSAAGAARAPATTPPACDAALTDADGAMSYMVGHITDQRLTQAIERFQTDRWACRHLK